MASGRMTRLATQTVRRLTNIVETMPVHRLVEILEAFTGGAGSNVVTVTVADQETFLTAARSPGAATCCVSV